MKGLRHLGRVTSDEAMMAVSRRWVMMGMATTGLTGCLGRSGEVGVEFHRNTKTPISSTTRFDVDRFSGFWHIRAEFLHPEEEALRGAVEFRAGAGKIAQIAMHGPKRSGFGVTDIYDVNQLMAGRFTLGQKPYQTEYWVLWVDDDYRTAAIGTPSGSFGWIIDRDRNGGEDRIKAAKDMLEFNGYNMPRLHMY